MTLLFRVLRAAHATGTHHKLALDALPLLQGKDAEGWRRLLLHHAAELMEGSKAPDDTFKDFKNHVLHPRDGYWGGAPEQADAWYQHLIAALRAGEWAPAARAAGILSHYLTDPIHPFHTGQSDAESNIHRALEWSVNRSYDALVAGAAARAAAAPIAIAIAPGAAGLKEFLCRAAERANQSYETLIAHYDIHAGTVDPPSGLDQLSRGILGELLILASSVVARVLERAFAEAAVSPPDVALTLDTVLATLRIPRKLLAKRLADADDRRVVQAMYDELMATGRVDKALPEDDRVVRDLYAKEVLPQRQAARDRDRAARAAVETALPPARVANEHPAVEAAAASTTAADADEPADTGSTLSTGNAPPLVTRPDEGEPLARLMPRAAPPRPKTGLFDPPPLPPGQTTAATPAPELVAAAKASAHALVAKSVPLARAADEARAQRADSRIHLSPSDELEAAPAIGPKTAERLAVAGLKTVADLLAADPDVVAAQAGQRSITADTVRDWQDQSRLVCSVPGLRGTGAQLLVGAGYRSLDAIAAADADKLCADVLAFATTSEGNRILRDGPPPDITRVKSWAENARAVKAA